MSGLSDAEIRGMLGDQEDDVSGGEQIIVQGSSGAEFQVLHEEEKTWYEETLQRYMEEYKFQNISDLQDIDRLLGLELLSYRYSNWLIRDTDYDGMAFDEKAVRDHKQKIDQEIRLIKSHMGMGRRHRVESEQQSTADYLQNLLRRAEEFGIHRNVQIAKAIDLFNDLKSLVGLHDRTDEEEAKHLGVATEDILDWIRQIAIPEYEAIDAAFRVEQRIWIREVS